MELGDAGYPTRRLASRTVVFEQRTKLSYETRHPRDEDEIAHFGKKQRLRVRNCCCQRALSHRLLKHNGCVAEFWTIVHCRTDVHLNDHLGDILDVRIPRSGGL